VNKGAKQGGKAGGSARKDRLQHAIREALTEAIASDVRDPRVHEATMLTVTKVEVSGKAVAYTAATGGITVTVPASGNLTVYGPGASGTITAVSTCW